MSAQSGSNGTLLTTRAAELEFADETRYKRTRFAVAAIGLSLVGALFLAIAVAYPYLY